MSNRGYPCEKTRRPLPHKQRPDMSLQNILADVFGNYRGVFIQSVGILRAHFGGHFVTYVQQLAEVLVVGRAGLIVA